MLKDIERLRHIFMHIDQTSRRIQDTIETNDLISAQEIEIRELKHIIETQNKALIEKGIEPKKPTTSSSSSVAGDDKRDNRDKTRELDSRSRDGSRRGKKAPATTAT